MDWSQLTHAYGPATDVPRLVQGLRTDAAGDCLSELFGSIVHQGTRYPATAPAVPLLVEAALDPAVRQRVGIGVLALIKVCAVGSHEDTLDWRVGLRLQEDDAARAAWAAVREAQPQLRPLLRDDDRSVRRATLAVLAWTGDGSDAVTRCVSELLASADPADRCAGWLAATVLGTLPAGVRVPAELDDESGVGRFGQAVASLRFAGKRATPAAVDTLIAALGSIEVDAALSACEFVAGESAESLAAAALERWRGLA